MRLRYLHCFFSIALISLALGCSSGKQVEERAEIEDRGVPAAGGEAVGGQSFGSDELQVPDVDLLEEQLPRAGQLSQRSIYFELDSDVLSTEYHQVVEAHAAHLANQPETIVTLEGHADERGTREYNLALGERRAQAIKRLMVLLGLKASQARTISYGEERPYANGHDEESWRLNRRVDLVY